MSIKSIDIKTVIVKDGKREVWVDYDGWIPNHTYIGDLYIMIRITQAVYTIQFIEQLVSLGDTAIIHIKLGGDLLERE